jgi:hypothetical protein
MSIEKEILTDNRDPFATVPAIAGPEAPGARQV